MYSYEYYEIFKNIYFEEHLPTATSTAQIILLDQPLARFPDIFGLKMSRKSSTEGVTLC